MFIYVISLLVCVDSGSTLILTLILTLAIAQSNRILPRRRTAQLSPHDMMAGDWGDSSNLIKEQCDCNGPI